MGVFLLVMVLLRCMLKGCYLLAVVGDVSRVIWFVLSPVAVGMEELIDAVADHQSDRPVPPGDGWPGRQCRTNGDADGGSVEILRNPCAAVTR